MVAGRPPDPVKKIPVLIRFDPDILRQLDAMPGRDRVTKLHIILREKFNGLYRE